MRSRTRLAGAAAGLCLLLVAASGLSPASQEPMPLERLVDRAQTRLHSIRDMRARFRQRQIQRPGAPATYKDGTWFIRTPGRMRVEYDDPPRIFVADGKSIYWYLPQDHQVQVRSTEGLDPSQMPTLYLSGEGDLRAGFAISGTRWEDLLAPGNIQVRLDPVQPDNRFTYLILEIQPETATVVRLVWFGLLGEAIDYQLYDIETDVGLADDLFQFTIPADAEVEYLGR